MCVCARARACVSFLLPARSCVRVGTWCRLDHNSAINLCAKVKPKALKVDEAMHCIDRSPVVFFTVSYIKIFLDTRTHTHTHTHTDTYKHTHKHTDARTHARAHTHVYVGSWRKGKYSGALIFENLCQGVRSMLDLQPKPSTLNPNPKQGVPSMDDLQPKPLALNPKP